MGDILKFSLLFVLASVVFVILGSSIELVFNQFSSSINYVTTGNIGEVLTAIIGFVGFMLDTLFLSTNTGYTTTYGGIQVYQLSWLFTIVRVIFGLAIVILIVKLVMGD